MRVGYLLTMKSNASDFVIGNNEGHGYAQIRRFIEHQLKEHGALVSVDGERLHTLRKEFSIPDDLKPLPGYQEADGEDDRELVIFDSDFSGYTDDEMWALINFFIEEGNMNVLFFVGATLISRA